MQQPPRGLAGLAGASHASHRGGPVLTSARCPVCRSLSWGSSCSRRSCRGPRTATRMCSASGRAWSRACSSASPARARRRGAPPAPLSAQRPCRSPFLQLLIMPPVCVDGVCKRKTAHLADVLTEVLLILLRIRLQTVARFLQLTHTFRTPAGTQLSWRRFRAVHPATRALTRSCPNARRSRWRGPRTAPRCSRSAAPASSRTRGRT